MVILFFRGAGVCCMHFLQKKANIEYRDKNGNTPLALAAMNKHEKYVYLYIFGTSIKILLF